MNYFTADQHFNHRNILKYCNRSFKDVEEMNRAIIEKHNNTVSDEDTIYMLGDFCPFFRNSDCILEFTSQLKGRKILILGNHDEIPPMDYVDAGFDSVHTSLDIGNFVLVHDPATSCLFPNRIVLCGHVHTLFVTTGNSINVGVDCWDFTPVSEPTILDFITNNMKKGNCNDY